MSKFWRLMNEQNLWFPLLLELSASVISGFSYAGKQNYDFSRSWKQIPGEPFEEPPIPLLSSAKGKNTRSQILRNEFPAPSNWDRIQSFSWAPDSGKKMKNYVVLVSDEGFSQNSWLPRKALMGHGPFTKWWSGGTSWLADILSQPEITNWFALCCWGPNPDSG